MLVTGSARAEDPAPVPVAGSASAEAPVPLAPKKLPPSSVRPRLIVAGIGIAGLAYGGAFLSAESTPGWGGVEELKIPVVGPWMALALNKCPDGENCDAWLYIRAGLLVADGLLQLGGLAMVAEGIFIDTAPSQAAPKPATASFYGPYLLSMRPAWAVVPALPAAPRTSGFEGWSRERTASFSIRPAPFVSPTMSGIGIVGTF